MFYRLMFIVFLIVLMKVHFVTLTSKSLIIACETNEDCLSFENATCQKPTCFCNGSRICKGKVIKMVTKIGEKCETSTECNIESAECRNFRCECKEGHVNSTDGKMCLKISEGINGNCQDDAQCYSKIPDSLCRNQKCICEGKHEYQGHCYKSVGLGETCKSDPECSIVQYSKCLNSVCRCIDGYVTTKNKSLCLLTAKGNDSSCVDNVQCTTTLGQYSHCTEEICRCKELYHYKDKINKCVKDRLLGEICTIHSDCHDPYPEKQDRLECIAGVCACRMFLKEINGMCIDDADNKGTRTSGKNIFYLIIYLVNLLLGII